MGKRTLIPPVLLALLLMSGVLAYAQVGPTPSLTCTPDGGYAGQTVTVQGVDFNPGGFLYQLRWDGVVIPYHPEGLTVGDDGTFTLSFTIPSDAGIIHTVVADDGVGGTAACYIDLLPANPTPTATHTPTLTPTPVPTWTPGPPPGVTVTPTAVPPDYCAEVEGYFRNSPRYYTEIDGGVTVRNTGPDWPTGRISLHIMKWYEGVETDTGERINLEAMASGEEKKVHKVFTIPTYETQVFFRMLMYDNVASAYTPCSSPWFPLYKFEAEPYPPPPLLPPGLKWEAESTIRFDWLPADVPYMAWPVDRYEVELFEVSSGTRLFNTELPAHETDYTFTIPAEYGWNELAWRVRAHNQLGWGDWTHDITFGVDTVRPDATVTLNGTMGANGWYTSPVEAEVYGSDPAPGSGVKATYLQIGEFRWQQVIPLAVYTIEDEGEYDVRGYVRDWSVNRGTIAVETAKLDWTNPVVGLVYSADPTSSGWYTHPITAEVKAWDWVSGVDAKLVRGDGSAWENDETALGTDGPHLLEYYARDVAGNESDTASDVAYMDLTPPTAGLALNGSFCQTCPPAVVSVASGDIGSGVAHWQLTVVYTGTTASVPQLASPLRDTITLASGDDAAPLDVELSGGSLPRGDTTLQLAVQDAAGWVGTTEIVAYNAPYTAGPTPTPWVMSTATPVATWTPVPWNWPTVTPTSTPDDGDDEDDDDGDGGGSGYTNAEGTPTSVPAILPVTGDEYPLATFLIVLGMALALGAALGLFMPPKRS